MNPRVTLSDYAPRPKKLDSDYFGAHCQIEDRPREDRPSTADRRKMRDLPVFLKEEKWFE